MRIAFTGHRDRLANERDLLAIEDRYPGAVWIHGGARGFDSQVDRVARRLGKRVADGTLVVIRPDYKQFHFKSAPIIRNREIVDEGEILYALWDGREEGGTTRTIGYARSRGKVVIRLAIQRSVVLLSEANRLPT